MPLGIAGFSYADLCQPSRLRDLHDLFYARGGRGSVAVGNGTPIAPLPDSDLADRTFRSDRAHGAAPQQIRGYFNERVAGLTLGSHKLRQRFEDPGLTDRERRVPCAPPAGVHGPRRSASSRSSSVVPRACWATPGPRSWRRAGGCSGSLEQRAAVLGVFGAVLDPRRPFVRVGADLDHAGLRDVALVGAAYGLATARLAR